MFGAQRAAPRCRRRRCPNGSRQVRLPRDALTKRGPGPFGARLQFVLSGATLPRLVAPCCEGGEGRRTPARHSLGAAAPAVNYALRVRVEPDGQYARSGQDRSMRSVPVLCCVVSGALLLPATAGAMSAVAPSVAVSPKVVLRGGSIMVTGRHWPRRTRVELLIGPPRSEAGHVAWVTTTSSGTLRKQLPIARRAATGRFVLLACIRSCRVKAQAPFRIVSGFSGAAANHDLTGDRLYSICQSPAAWASRG